MHQFGQFGNHFLLFFEGVVFKRVHLDTDLVAAVEEVVGLDCATQDEERANFGVQSYQ